MLSNKLNKLKLKQKKRCEMELKLIDVSFLITTLYISLIGAILFVA